MSDQFSIKLHASFSQNLSPAAESSKTEAIGFSEYKSNETDMQRIGDVAKSQGMGSTFSSERVDERQIRHGASPLHPRHGRLHYGGGPVIDHLSTLHIAGAIGGAIGLIKAARPILVEYLKSRRASFTFRHGDLTIKLDGPDSLQKVEAHLEALISLAESTEDKKALAPSPRKPKKAALKKIKPKALNG